jgi:hypothetical protein
MGRIIQNGIVYSSNSSGGSGGHTILDNEGDELTQRTNLQFKGAYSDDNATDDTTEVNVAREMTKAEFDLLSADEKVGFINVTDITPAPYDKFQPVIYSEDEREIGVYTDGKPLYEKTIYSATVTNATEVAHNIANIDKVAEVRCNVLRYGAWNSGNFIFENSNLFSVVVSKTAYYCICAPTTGVYSNLYLTIRYTKTTDTAGSGIWTPQGVPAHHYSTDEHIIGTWIDGSTLYEKTLHITESSEQETKIYDYSALNADFLQVTEARIKLGAGAGATWCSVPIIGEVLTQVVCVYTSDSNLVIRATSYKFTEAYITLRYTKSSS